MHFDNAELPNKERYMNSNTMACMCVFTLPTVSAEQLYCEFLHYVNTAINMIQQIQDHLTTMTMTPISPSISLKLACVSQLGWHMGMVMGR